MPYPQPPRHATTVGLFDRILGETEDEPLRPQLSAAQEAHQSLNRDLRRLLNTRRAGTNLLDPATATVLDYGIPNFIPMSSLQDMEKMAGLIQNAILVFEPRLLSPEVRLSPMDGRPDRLVGTITGSLRGDSSRRRLSFPLAVDPQSGTAEVLEQPDENS